jgi:hypothetical protein
MPVNCLVLFGRDIFSLSAPWKFVFSSVVGFFFFFFNTSDSCSEKFHLYFFFLFMHEIPNMYI